MTVRDAALTGLLTLGSLSIGCAGREAARPEPGPREAGAGAQPAPGACDASRAQFAIGSPVTTALVERARTAAQARSSRVIRPNDMVTMDFSDSRLNLHLDEKDIVRSVRCG